MRPLFSGHCVNLLWTGGWDSTFRLLSLVLIKRKPVQPFYVIDVGRVSTIREIKTMQHKPDAIVRHEAQP